MSAKRRAKATQKQFTYVPTSPENLLRRLERSLEPQAAWDDVEQQYAPLRNIQEEDLVDILLLFSKIARVVGHDAIYVPAIIAAEFLLPRLVKNLEKRGEKLTPEDQLKLKQAKALVKKLFPRPRGGQTKSWWRKRVDADAVRDILERAYELIGQGLPIGQALDQAASEISPGYNRAPSTMLKLVGKRRNRLP